MGLFEKDIKLLSEAGVGGFKPRTFTPDELAKADADRKARVADSTKQAAQRNFQTAARDAKIHSERAFKHSASLKPGDGNHDMAAEDHLTAANHHRTAAYHAQELGDQEAYRFHHEARREHLKAQVSHEGQHRDYVGSKQGGGHQGNAKGSDPGGGAGLPDWLHGVKTHKEAQQRYRAKALETHPDREMDPAQRPAKAAAFRQMHSQWKAAQAHPHFPKPTAEDIALKGVWENFDRLTFDELRMVY